MSDATLRWQSRRRSLLQAIGGLLLARCADADEVAEKIESGMKDLLRTTRVPGLSVSYVRGGSVAWSRGFGVRSVDHPAPVDADTVFEAASLSKPAFAYAVLQLVQQGKLNLDAPLAEYVPKPWITTDPRISRITARMVLSHSSGLPHGRAVDSPVTIRFDPGSRFAYSANGFEYLRTG